MKILGLDPSLSSFGYALVEGKKVITRGTIKTKVKDGSFEDRCEIIDDRLSNIFLAHTFDMVAIEDVFINRRNYMTSIKLAKVHGIALTNCFRHVVPRKVYAPSEVKESITGSGRADKEQVMKMVKIMTDYRGNSDDESDAIAVALTCERDINVITKRR
jgi:crossover junction endodeoxyribonuclease RuvC